MGEPYSRYAAIYDQTGQQRFSLLAWRRIAHRLADLGWEGRDVLELACGTGALAEQLAASGFAVVAADRSRDMLLAALARGADPPFAVVRCDFRALPFAPSRFDLVTCLYDSLNYLPDPDALTKTLREVERVLRPGGIFVFDLNTPYALREHWVGLCDAAAGRDVAYIWRGEWLGAAGVSRLHATFFVRGADGRYDRFDEIHDERGFEECELRRAFAAAGLNPVRIEDPLTGRRPAPDCRRVFYYVRKPR